MLFDFLKARANILTDDLFSGLWKKGQHEDPEPDPEVKWETLYENPSKGPNAGTPYNYFWLSSMANIYPTAGSVWRITIDDIAYQCTAITEDNTVYIGNPKYSNKTDNGSDAPFSFYNNGYGGWIGDTNLPVVMYSIKIEQMVKEEI